MKIEELVSRTYPTANAYSATTLLEDKIIENGYVVLSDNEHGFQGILTSCDLVQRPHKLAIDCLTPKKHLDTKDTIATCLMKFNRSQCLALPLFKNNRFIGIVKKHDVVDKLKDTIENLYRESIISQKVKQSFLDNLSHEIRTPLNGMLGFLELISDINIENSKTEREAYCKIIRKSADRFLLIFNDLISLALLNSGENITVEIEKTDINGILQELTDYFEHSIQSVSKNITLLCEISREPLTIYTDKNKIKHILYHLIDNAVKFSSDYSKVYYGYRIENYALCFFVRNTCAGIADDKKHKIFDIFEKAYQPTNELTDGLGIGLPLVKKLVTLLNGSVELITENQQVTFLCSIPIDTKQ